MRTPALDGLRGTAALVVFAGHLANLSPALFPYQAGEPGGWVRSVLVNSPLHLFFDGHGAVVLFWVLSGLVLTPPFLRVNPPDVWQYLVSRWARIWIPFAVVLLLALILKLGTAPVDTAHLGTPYAVWVTASWEAFWRSLLLLDSAPYEQLLGVAWSLVHEARFSLLLPFLLPLTLRFPIWTAVAVVTISLYAGQHTFQQDLSWLGTARYLMAFMLGAGVAVVWDRVPGWVAQISRRERALVTLATVLVGTVTWWGSGNDSRAPLTDWLHLPLSVWLIALCLSGGSLACVLSGQAAQWLGRVSYSLYLIHLPVILLVLHGLHPLPMAAQVLVMVALSFGAAHLLHRYVERPAQQLGKRIHRVPGPPQHRPPEMAGEPPART